MKIWKLNIALLLSVLLLSISCKKETEPEGESLPPGAIPYTAAELAFVPYSLDNQVFKKAPEFTQELTLKFKDHLTEAVFYAWDQRLFSLSTDSDLVIELRLRYLQTENSTLKSLAIYMPFRDDSGELRTSIFELPVDPTGLESGFFSELVTFHEMLDLSGREWNNVYEVNAITTIPVEFEHSSNFEKVYYNTTQGIVGMNQKNGNKWVLIP